MAEDGFLQPAHDNFDEYLPWACNRQQIYTNVIITKAYLSGFALADSLTSRSKVKTDVKINHNLLQDESGRVNENGPILDDVVKIQTVYNKNDNMVQLKFINNRTISRMVLKVIGLIVEFQSYLTNVTINKGLDNPGILELKKWLPLSTITNICLDDTAIPDGDYDLLLENKSSLKQLSLSRCNINDDVLKKIAAKLAYPLPVSKTLTILMLTSNKITNEGAKYVAEALRTNRQLAYLNLADNLISDEGSIAILNVLTEFLVSNEELVALNCRRMNFVKEKIKMMSKIMKELESKDIDRNHLKKSLSARSSSATTNTTGRRSKDVKQELVKVTEVDDANSIEMLWEDEAKAIAVEEMGNFNDPFSSNNIHKKDGQIYCHGNNNLAYLNFSYNDLSYISVKKLLAVLLQQKMLKRKPRGLVNVSIEGNNLPINCEELNEIDRILDSCLTVSKKRPTNIGRQTT